MSADSKKGRGRFESDKPPVVTLVHRSDGRVTFLVRENLQDVDKEIAERGDETVILCTDDYTIYNDIDEFEEIAAHLAITHGDTYVIGDAHVNSCENRHSSYENPAAETNHVADSKCSDAFHASVSNDKTTG